MLGRFEARRLSALDAEELLAMSERTFRRYRRRWERAGWRACLTAGKVRRAQARFRSIGCPRLH